MGCAPSKDAKPPQQAASQQHREFQEEIPTGPDLRPDAQHIWYWEEDAERIGKHHTWDKQGNFVAYPPRVSEYIESEHQAWSSGKTQESSFLEITYKCFAEASGFNYRVEFSTMHQINGGTGFKRKLLRRQNPNYVESPPDSCEESAKGNTESVPKAPPPAYLFNNLRTMPTATFCKVVDQGPLDLDAEAPGGGTLLTWAAECHRADIVQALLQRHVDVNKTDSSSGQTALQWASNTQGEGEGEQLRDGPVVVDRAATIAHLTGAMEATGGQQRPGTRTQGSS